MRLCREKTTGNVYAMKKLKKSEMLRRGQVCRCGASFRSMYFDNLFVQSTLFSFGGAEFCYSPLIVALLAKHAPQFFKKCLRLMFIAVFTTCL